MESYVCILWSRRVYSRTAIFGRTYAKLFGNCSAAPTLTHIAHNTVQKPALTTQFLRDSNIVSSEHYGQRCTTLTLSTKLTKLSNISLTAIDIIRFVYVSGWVCVCVCKMKTMSSYGFASRRTPVVSERSVAMRTSVRRSVQLSSWPAFVAEFGEIYVFRVNFSFGTRAPRPCTIATISDASLNRLAVRMKAKRHVLRIASPVGPKSCGACELPWCVAMDGYARARLESVLFSGKTYSHVVR